MAFNVLVYIVVFHVPAYTEFMGSSTPHLASSSFNQHCDDFRGTPLCIPTQLQKKWNFMHKRVALVFESASLKVPSLGCFQVQVHLRIRQRIDG